VARDSALQQPDRDSDKATMVFKARNGHQAQDVLGALAPQWFNAPLLTMNFNRSPGNSQVAFVEKTPELAGMEIST
jgi:hypothetical protein